MRALAFTSCLAILCLSAGTPVVAQEGHPLKGSWLGTWGPSQHHSNDILVVMDWDGANITGTINPGTDDMPIRNATLDPDGWVLRFEAQGKAQTGAVVNYVIEGRIENISFHNRSVVGTWKNETESGRFEISRQ